MKKILTWIFATTLSLTAQEAPKEAPVDAPRPESPKQGGGDSEKLRSQGTKEVAKISTRASTYATSRVAPVVRPASTASRSSSVSRVNLRRPTAKATTTVAPTGG